MIDLDYIVEQPITFASLTAGVLLGEMLPVKIPRRGNDEMLTLSTAFSMALLLAGGLGPALIAQGIGSVIQDVASGKVGWRSRFNLGQYTIALIAAMLAMRAISHISGIPSAHPLDSSQLPALLIGSAVFFLVNTAVVNLAIAIYQEVSVIHYFRNNFAFVVVAGGAMLCLAPIVVAAISFSVLLVPLFLAPVVAIHHAVWQGARNEHAARHDPLTGLPNRTAFRETVEDTLRSDAQPSCLLLVDLDRFKEVNDTLGHRYGDLLLQQVAERFREQLGRGDQIARLGGDEFAIFSHGRDREASMALAQSIATALRSAFELEHIEVDAQASVGIALYPEDGTDVETLVQKADVAMYRAKGGHADFALYDERHDHNSPARLALTAALRAAVETEGLIVWYQPVLDLNTGDVLSVEALVRWQHPELGLLTPASFLEIAELTNLIKPLTQRVLDTSLAQVASWREQDIDVVVAVNVSTRVLVDENFPGLVVDSLRNAGVPANRLKLEITESTLIADPVTARAVLRELDRLGIEISIDDFGTGYSSLAYLADLPVSEIKIDQSFVSRMAAGSSETIIVSSTIDLAHHLGLRAIAEGVEDGTLLPELKELGCDGVQGFEISKPLAADDATRWLIDHNELTAVEHALRYAA
ncbi:MAG TPA: EAL domain-containing protein [Solirubrobacteraceae bacterium]|nr:EAL domain-containing protein [Solirubrobacteraceae bacterium]